MTNAQREVVSRIARDAAAHQLALDDALAAHVLELAPLIDRNVTALEIVRAAEIDYEDMLRWQAFQRSRLAV